MRLLDLFCGAGGAGMGYHLAGFDEIVGVDLAPQPHYPFRFFCMDALEALETVNPKRFDLIHASPPCQGYTTMSNRHPDAQAARPRLIEAVREQLERLGTPYVIENVVGARSALRDPMQLCGSSFGLPIWRHRLFETNPRLLMVPPCSHAGSPNELGIYGQRHDGRLLWRRSDGSELRAPRTLTEAQEAMGMPWADWHGVKEAIPPAFTRWIGEQILARLEREAA